MKKLFYPLAASLIFLTSMTFVMEADVQEYSIDSSYYVKFKSKDPSGSFEDLSGTIKFDKEDLANSSFDLSINVSSINTGNGMQSKKALTSEWFNASKYPKITFKSTKVYKTEEGYFAGGDLTIKGVTRKRKIPMNISDTDSGLKFTGSFTVDRTSYGVGEAGGTVPNKLKITYSIPVNKK